MANLRDKRVLVTRAADQAGALSALLAQHGACPIELPAIAITPMSDYAALDAAIGRLDSYDWVIFTSVNGVRYFFQRLAALGRSPAGVRSQLCAIGPATTKSLADLGLTVALQPQKYIAEAIVEALKRFGVGGAHVLVPRAREAREVLVHELVAAGAMVDEVAVYETVRPPDVAALARTLFQRGEIDIVTFTSSSTVRNLLALLDGDIAPLAAVTVACIGPITSQTAREHGLRVDVESAEHTIPGLVRAILDFEKEQVK